MKAIQDRGRLVAGVSQENLLLGYLNPHTNQLEGFDIDVAKLVAKAIFGDDRRILFRPITPAQRLPLVQDGSVDIVALSVTVNCARWKQVAFSTIYYEAGQRLLVRRDSTARGIEDMGGKRVCSAAGTTSIDNVANAPSRPIVVAAPDFADCLVLFQQGKADAISTDDTVLVGLAAQDPYAKIVGPKFTEEPYGLAISHAHPDFVRFVNGVLEQMRADGTWTATYNRWLARLGGPPTPPPARYRD